MKHIKSLLFLSILLSTFSFARQKPIAIEYGIEIPKLKQSESPIIHKGFTFLYNEPFELSSWVAYVLSSNETQRIVERSNIFRVDSRVKTGTANDKDYSKSGYDRGHLAPAGDMGWSLDAMNESFYYSNISPQVPGFNRGVWKRCEEVVRRWAVTYDSIYIVTGPVLREGLPTIGKNKVAIPMFYYKVIIRYDKEKLRGSGIAFVLPNISSKNPLKSFVTSIDKVEQMTGIDFFPLIPDDIEQQLERSEDPNDWKWD